MVVINVATTSPINPPSAAPVLAVPEVWKALLVKCREPEKFVKPIRASRVTKEEGNEIVRFVTVEEDMGPPGETEEHIKLMEPLKADFFVPSTKQHVENIVSRGKGGEHDLYMTFTFEWYHPEVTEGSEEHRKLEEKYWAMGEEVVEKTIEATRDMKKAGKLE